MYGHALGREHEVTDYRVCQCLTVIAGGQRETDRAAAAVISMLMVMRISVHS